jgi:hypothetical protein
LPWCTSGNKNPALLGRVVGEGRDGRKGLLEEGQSSLCVLLQLKDALPRDMHLLRDRGLRLALQGLEELPIRVLTLYRGQILLTVSFTGLTTD